jgi:hypothetical protein
VSTGVSDADAASTVLVYLLSALDTIACVYLTAQRAGPVTGGPVDDADTSASDLRAACIKVPCPSRVDLTPACLALARVHAVCECTVLACGTWVSLSPAPPLPSPLSPAPASPSPVAVAAVALSHTAPSQPRHRHRRHALGHCPAAAQVHDPAVSAPAGPRPGAWRGQHLCRECRCDGCCPGPRPGLDRPSAVPTAGAGVHALHGVPWAAEPSPGERLPSWACGGHVWWAHVVGTWGDVVGGSMWADGDFCFCGLVMCGIVVLMAGEVCRLGLVICALCVRVCVWDWAGDSWRSMVIDGVRGSLCCRVDGLEAQTCCAPPPRTPTHPFPHSSVANTPLLLV